MPTRLPRGPRGPKFTDPTDDLLGAITKEPGISREVLKERGFITDGLAGDSRLQALLSNGKAIAIDGHYYPWTKEYLELKQSRGVKRSQPTGQQVVVYKDPSVIGEPHPAATKLMQKRERWKAHDAQIVESPAQSVAKAICSAVRSVSVQAKPEPVEVEAVEVVEATDPEPTPDPSITLDTSETVSEAPATLSPRERCVAAINELVAEGKPFTRNRVTEVARISSAFFCDPRNHDLREQADQAIAKVGGKHPRSKGPRKSKAVQASPAVGPATGNPLEDAIAQVTADRDATTAAIAKIDAQIQELRRERGYLVQVEGICDRLLDTLTGGAK